MARVSNRYQLTFATFQGFYIAMDDKRLARARTAIEGLSVGDAFDDRWFFTRRDVLPFKPIEDRRLPPKLWEYTDDTQMALSIVEVLRKYGYIDPDRLAHSVA